MRGKKAQLPPASGARMCFNEDAAGRLKKKSARGEPEDVTFMGPQLIIALVAAVFIGGIAGVLFRDQPATTSRPPAAQAPHASSAAPAPPGKSAALLDSGGRCLRGPELCATGAPPGDR